MATQRFITLNGGRLAEVVPATASAGVGDAGKIVALNASGVIDPTMRPFAVLDVSLNGVTATDIVQTIPQAFTAIQLNTVNTDNYSGWDNVNFAYTIPVNGTYLITTKMRPGDGVAANNSYGQGANGTLADGPWFQWFVTVVSNGQTYGGRNGSLNARVVYLTAGSKIYMYAYGDVSGGVPIHSAAMNIVLL